MTSTSARIRNLRRKNLATNRDQRKRAPGAPTLGGILSYRFDNWFARGPVAILLMLASFSALIVILGAVFISIIPGATPSGDSGPLGFLNLLYKSFLHSIDTGTVGGDTGSAWFLFFMVMVTLGGIFVVSALIGVITTGMDQKMEELRRGHSAVIEQGHSLLLGWSPAVFTIISELIVANENQASSCVVVVGPEDKVAMEEAIKERIDRMGRTRIVCRSGSPIDPTNLRLGSPHTAKAVIILAPETDDPDSQVIKTLLALVNGPVPIPETTNIVAEIQDESNLEVARIACADRAKLVLASDLIARITVQTCRQSGLSSVYNELLDFDGDEIYFADLPEITGRTFGDVLSEFRQSTIIGVHKGDRQSLLKPPMEYVFQPGDQAIAITEDDDTLRLEPMQVTPDESAISNNGHEIQRPERTLILGWNDSAPRVLTELDEYVTPGSSTVVVGPDSIEDGVSAISSTLKRYSVSTQSGDPTSRPLLDNLDLSGFDHVIVLGGGNKTDPQEADARTLVTLLHLRDIQNKTGAGFSIVSEMADVRNRELAEVTRADDFVVSDQLVSLLMTQISENPSLSDIFEDLFDSEGSEIYLKPASRYVKPGAVVDFYTVVEAARRRNEVAIGYRLTGSDDAPVVIVNPDKANRIAFGNFDRVVVIADE